MADEWGDEDGDEWGDDGGDGDEWGDAGDGDNWGDDPNADGIGDDAIDVDDWRINVENKFYTAEGRRREEPKEALGDFLECIKKNQNTMNPISEAYEVLKICLNEESK